jgi:YebC/PmpR family DNA-binding regulatory protein
MSGHSKWAQIKRQKGANDAKRGLQFTKLSNAITLAVRQGGGIGDPAQNFRLRLAIEAARASNMPKDNIERAIERATSKTAGAMEEVVYEGFGPGGIALIVEAATDNKNRTVSEVKNLLEKNGGTMGQMGTVAYQFKQNGILMVAKDANVHVDDVLLAAADMGAEDVEDTQDVIVVTTAPSDLAKVREGLVQAGYTVTDAQIVRTPTLPVAVDNVTAEKVLALMEKLEELDDVQNVFSNLAQ